MKKYKITYFRNGYLCELSFDSYSDWYGIVSDLGNKGIATFEIIKIELLPVQQTYQS